MPESANPILHLQLSSPIEEGTLSKVVDSQAIDEASEGSIVTFKGVEISTATLTVSAKDADIPLGSSIPHDLGPLCSIDPMEPKDFYETEVPVAIVGEGGNDNTSEPLVPVCTVTLKATYKASPKDQREALYEILNKTSQRKATALENLRKISISLARESPSANKSAGTVVKPSVKPGFLNKKPKEQSQLQKIYEQTIGPNSMLAKGLGIALVSRNYLIFFGAVAAFHFKGQLVSLPPPV